MAFVAPILAILCVLYAIGLMFMAAITAIIYFILKEIQMPLDFTSISAAVDATESASKAAITAIQAGGATNLADQAALEALAQRLGVTVANLNAAIAAGTVPTP